VGDWLRKPSPRFFYLERDAWLADWRNQQSPQAILEKAIAATAFPGHPYSRLAADVAEAETLRVGDFEKFALAHYVPSNSVVAIVGDISAAEARRLATQYFGPIPASAVPPPPVGAVPDLRAVPELREDKPVSVALPLGAATPTAMAWPRPARTDPDDAVFDVVWAILTGGRELSLASGLDADKIAATPGVLPSFPGDRLPAVFAISAVPLRAIAPGDLEKSLDAAVGRLRTKPISDKELAIVKAGLEARLLSETERPGTMAALLARFLASDGSVEAIGKAWQRIDKVTPADIQRVAGKYLRDRGRVILQATQGGD
jgi:predicted Zn-dependent peptidase